jgi:hypothetical protein
MTSYSELITTIDRGLADGSSSREKDAGASACKLLRGDLGERKQAPTYAIYMTVLSSVATALEMPDAPSEIVKPLRDVFNELKTRLSELPLDPEASVTLERLHGEVTSVGREAKQGTRATIVSSVVGLVISTAGAFLIAFWYGESTDAVLKSIREDNAKTHARLEESRVQETALIAAGLSGTKSQAYIQAVRLLSDRAAQYAYYGSQKDFEAALCREIFRKCPQLTCEETVELSSVFCHRPSKAGAMKLLRSQHVAQMEAVRNVLDSEAALTFNSMDQSLTRFVSGDHAVQYAGCFVCAECRPDAPCEGCSKGTSKDKLMNGLQAEIDAYQKGKPVW